jgi:rod shape-determining protein MreC
VRADESREFATIYSEPVAQIDRLRYMLLLSKDETAKTVSPKSTNKAVGDKS